jgi:hypothetical protein
VTVYSVYEPISDDADIAARAGKVAFVKEGFAWFALIMPALWLFYHRMWIELIVFLAVFVGLQFAFGFDELGQALFSWVALAITILFAFEANDLRGTNLQRRGYRFAGIVTGRGQSDAERSFFTDWLPQQERAAQQAPVKKAAPAPKPPLSSPSSRGADDDVIGLFPQA